MGSKGLQPAKAGLRVGVIGAGVMGSNHARVLAGLPGVTSHLSDVSATVHFSSSSSEK